MKKFLSRLGVFSGVGCLSLGAFADGTTTTIAVTDATNALTSMQTAITTYWTSASPVVVAVAGIALVATLIWVGFKLIRKGANKIG